MARNRIQFQSFLQQVNQALDEAEERALLKVGIYVQGESQDRTPVDTGNLRDSNNYQVEMSEKKVIVGNHADYALFIHEGTSRMAPRRFLEESVTQNTSRIQELINEEFESL